MSTSWRSMRMPIDVAECVRVPMPRIEALRPHRTGEPARDAARRLEAWYEALQDALGDSRPLRCERVWLSVEDHEALEAWVTEPIPRTPTGRYARSWGWTLSAPSCSEDVPPGVVAVQPDAWDAPPG